MSQKVNRIQSLLRQTEQVLLKKKDYLSKFIRVSSIHTMALGCQIFFILTGLFKIHYLSK